MKGTVSSNIAKPAQVPEITWYPTVPIIWNPLDSVLRQRNANGSDLGEDRPGSTAGRCYLNCYLRIAKHRQHGQHRRGAVSERISLHLSKLLIS